MTLPTVSSRRNRRKKKPSLVLTLSAAGLLIGGGIAAYWLFTQGQPLSRDLPIGANIIPDDALFAVSLTTDHQQWQKLREFGTLEAQRELDKNLVIWRERLFTNNGYDFQKDVKPWVGDGVTIAMLSPRGDGNQESLVMVLPIKNLEVAEKILSESKPGNWVERSYQGFVIKEIQKSGKIFSVALLDQRFLVISDNSTTIERAIAAYKNKTSLAQLASFKHNFPKIASYQSFAQFYLNVPTAAKIAQGFPNRRLPAQVLTQLQNNQGLAGTVTLEPQGMRFKGISWLNPQSQRLLAVENNAGGMKNRLPGETLMMLSGSNLQRWWGDYVSTSEGNPLSPITPKEVREGVKSLTSLDLERDLLSWLQGEFALAVIPKTPKNALGENFQAGLVFMSKISQRQAAETALQKLDEVMKNQYQFQIQPETVAGKPVVNWISPFGALTATHGWLDDNIVFLVVGAPISDKILSRPNNPLVNTPSFQQTVITELNPPNGQFFLDVEQTVKSFIPNNLPGNQQTFLQSIRTIGVTTAINDSRSQRYDVFLSFKKVDK
ncbi:DUF3352 domain-containing protein [Cronbergia sp. UHCC 0137]|uniref:DUF3352 domain-containing protein n=1 Tax=Cronbergia sp. UHCC 0137 TaxID=3110239 RepID=UPI002B21A7A6|nr:DUF3352 domain-containing protein [Cronbergia sp. UHCC 0137]MEA5618883.1 DUF3352 domain-containing protein [Cronbergia sp. UHCC 0137]